MSSDPSFNPWYEPTENRGHFTRDVEYREVIAAADRGDLRTIIGHFEQRLRGWYIDPIDVLLETDVPEEDLDEYRRLGRRDEGGHYSFAVLAMTCLLIDTLSQYETGNLESNQDVFRCFVKRKLPCYAASLTRSIETSRRPLDDVAGVVYSGFRCGILHEAHAPLYCWIQPGEDPPVVADQGYATYGTGAQESIDGDPCPTVKLQPGHLFKQVKQYFERYLANLRDSDSEHDDLRRAFKTKFMHSFGIDISQATISANDESQTGTEQSSNQQQ